MVSGPPSADGRDTAATLTQPCTSPLWFTHYLEYDEVWGIVSKKCCLGW
jgi:hypothetical protein